MKSSTSVRGRWSEGRAETPGGKGKSSHGRPRGGGERETPEASGVTLLSQEEDARQPGLGARGEGGHFSQVSPELGGLVGVCERHSQRGPTAKSSVGGGTGLYSALVGKERKRKEEGMDPFSWITLIAEEG